MKKEVYLLIILCLFGITNIRVNAQTTSTSSNLVAQPIPDRTVPFSATDPGVSKPVTFGLDLAWLSEDNIRRGIAFMGKPQVRIIRSSFTPTDSLVNGDLKPNEMNILNQRLNIINTWMGPATIALNTDNPSVSSWYKNANGTINAARWAQLIDVTTRRHQEAGHTVITVGPFNEPDNPTGQGSMQDFYNIAGELKNNPRFSNIRIGGGNTLNDNQALPWYNFLKPRLDEGNTHQLAGNFDNFASFYQTVRADGRHASGDELHNVMEAMVGAEYGMQTGIWWGTAELARGEFVKTSDGVRLGYAEHRPNWTAASVYRAPDGKVQAFGGTSERQAATTTYRFVSKDKDVYYDGYGPQREYTMVLPGGAAGSYQNGQTNAERVVNITWGEDIQPAINGRYVLVNRNSGQVLQVPGGSTTAGTFLQQGSYSGQTYQQWNVAPVDSRIGGDFSYFTFTAVHSGKAPDVYNWSLDNGGKIDAWDDSKGNNQQWYLEYAGDGWFYIRSRHSAKCLEASADGVNIDQWDKNGNNNQQWRLLPIDAAIEFNAPGAPGSLAAIANATSIRLNWTASSEADVAGYTIFRSASAAGTYNTIARNVTTTSFVDNSAAAGVAYFYKIKAVDKSLNRSVYSDEVSATPTGVHDTIVHLHFDGNTLDSTKNLNHSAAYGGISFGGGVVGSKAIALNGSSFIQLPATIANHQEITIAAWVNWKGGGAWQRIFDFGNDQTQYMFLTPGSGSGQLRFAIKNGGGEQGMDAPALPTGVWSHVAVTLGASGASLYVNGQVVAQSSNITIRPMDFKPILNYIGRSQYPDPLFNGSVDDFQMFNYSLSASEIQQLINLGLPAAVTNPRVASGDAKVILRWEGRFDTKYEVLRSETTSGTYSVVATNINVTRYEDVNVVNGKTYYYKVVAYNTSGRSPETLLIGNPVLGQHVYLPFNEAAGSVAEDVWGAKDATLAAAASHGDGYNSAHSLALNGTANSYATLPAGVVSTLNDFTISTWVKPNAIDWWMRVFDFGSGGNNYMFLTLQAGWNNWVTTVRYAIKNGGGEQQVNYDYLIPWNAWTHFAVTQSGNTARLYINGNLVASNSGVTIKPSNLGSTTQNYIGKSQFPDPMLNASVDQFKIYNRALSAAELAQAMKAEQPIGFTATVSQPKCSGETGSVILSTPTGGTGSYKFNETSTTNLGEGDYRYIATDANGSSDTQTVHVNAAPAAISFTATVSQPKCAGETGSVALSTPTGGTGTITFNNTPTTNLAPGSYTYTATDANGCQASQTVVINAAPAAISFTATVSQPKCAGETGSVALSTPTGGTGAITFNNTPTTNLEPGSYTYTATDANGCQALQTFVINAAPAAIVSSVSAQTNVNCYDAATGSATISASGGTGTLTYSWLPGGGTGATATNLKAGTYTITLKDDNGCTQTQTVTITQPALALKATCLANTPDNTLYFGYSGDQAETINVTPSGGVAPYTVQIKLSRPLLCNQVNDAGDEVWTGGSGGTTINNACPVNPELATLAPVSAKTISSGSYGVTVTLMADAYVIATVTDVNGCTYTCSTFVHADDVRCFAGNSGNAKITICHKTGSARNPCVTMCVDEDALNEHLAHGDFPGKCTSNCYPSSTTAGTSSVSAMASLEEHTSTLEVKVMNNPSVSNVPFRLKVVSNNEVDAIQMRVMDGAGKPIEFKSTLRNGQTIEIGRNYIQGMYFVEVIQGSEHKMAKLVKQ